MEADPNVIYTDLGIELYNPYTTPINLAEYRLEDRNKNPIGIPWGTIIPPINATIAPNDRFIIRLADDPGKLTTDIKIDLGTARHVDVFWANLNNASPISIVRTGTGQGICIDIAPALPIVEPTFNGDFHWITRFRDDRRDAARYAVGGAYHDATDLSDPNKYDYTVINMGSPNPIGLPYAPGPPVPVYVRNDPTYNPTADFVFNIGELTKLYYVGPSPIQPLSLALQAGDRGIDPCSNVVANIPPRVPLASLLSEFLMVRSPERAGLGTSVYGLVNINTAPVSVLKCLPGLAKLNDDVVRNKVATEIAAYRDQLNNTGNGGKNYDSVTKTREDATGITNLRNEPGFATSGEIAIPIRQVLPAAVTTYSNNEPNNYTVTTDGSDDGLDTAAPSNDPDKYNVYYKWLSNQVTVRSDTYIAYILVRPPGITGQDRRFVALIDRSNCDVAGKLPQVLMMAEVK